MKNTQILIGAAVALVVGLFLARRANAVGPTGVNIAPAAPWVPRGSLPASLTVGEKPYTPQRTDTAATLPYGFKNSTPGGEFINGFV